MNPEDLRQAVAGEMHRGDEAFRASEVLPREGLYSDAMSRAYYAALHYARAALLRGSEEPGTHEGVLRRFSLRFVKTGLVAPADGKVLSRLFKFRQEADYGAESASSSGDIARELAEVRRFREAVARVLSDPEPPPPARR